MQTLTEKQIEDVFERFHEQLLESGLTLLDRQHIFDNRLRADLLFRDKNGTTVLVELKRKEVTRDSIGQLIEYHGMFASPKIRIILAAPFIPEAIRKSFEHFGIEYVQFSMTQIEKFYHSIKNRVKDEVIKKNITLPKTIITRPLSEKIIDGNIAFKVTYNDKNWSDVCSPNVAKFNFAKRVWCRLQSKDDDNCQSKQWKKKELDKPRAPCYDSVALKSFSFYPGHFHGPKRGDNEPKRCLGAKMGKIAIFTSIEPNANENERFIMAIGQINNIRTLADDGFEQIYCDKETGLFFLGNNKPKFWKYYTNSNTDRIAWGSGLFRYLNDITVRNIIEDIIKSERLLPKEKVNAEYLLNQL